MFAQGRRRPPPFLLDEASLGWSDRRDRREVCSLDISSRFTFCHKLRPIAALMSKVPSSLRAMMVPAPPSRLLPGDVSALTLMNAPTAKGASVPVASNFSGAGAASLLAQAGSSAPPPQQSKGHSTYSSRFTQSAPQPPFAYVQLHLDHSQDGGCGSRFAGQT